jgi:hypothetical protein
MEGKRAQGRKELIKYRKGGRLTRKEAVLAMCYDCMGLYIDGKNDCQIPECPLYFWMPYRANK